MAKPATVLVLQFQNGSSYSDLNWVGESISETLISELAAANQIVPARSERAEAQRRLMLKPGAEYTEATMIRLGETLDADTVCFGSFTVALAQPDAALKDSSIRITAQFLDLRKMHRGPEITEAGPLSELSRLQEHLAYEVLHTLEPNAKLDVQSFLSPQKLIRLDAQESYVRGLLSTNKDQRQKWFTQAAALDGKFAGPAFELGRLALEQKQYAQALDWLKRILSSDPNYPEARFKMGLAAYNLGDFPTAAGYFREVTQVYPLAEVYNDLGAAENEMNSAGAIVDFHHALESDPKSVTYLFNLSTAQVRTGDFDGAAKTLQQLLQHSDDAEAQSLMERAHSRQGFTDADKMPLQRLKISFDQTAFRQLKALLQAKGS